MALFHESPQNSSPVPAAKAQKDANAGLTGSGTRRIFRGTSSPFTLSLFDNMPLFSRLSIYFLEKSSKSVRWRTARLPHPDGPRAARGALVGIVQAVQLAPASAAPDRRGWLALRGPFSFHALLYLQSVQPVFKGVHLTFLREIHAHPGAGMTSPLLGFLKKKATLAILHSSCKAIAHSMRVPADIVNPP